MPILQPDERLTSSLLGDCYPYWWQATDGSVSWAPFAHQAVEQIPEERRTLDPVSVMAIMSFQHLAVDRTMVQGLQRVPWLGEVDGRGEVRYASAPPHGSRRASTETIADGLSVRLREELRGHCDGHDRVYVLLSGGMDSRVLSAALKSLQDAGEIDAEIEAVTWGTEGCRDVHYARRICDHLGWNWNYAPLTSSTYRDAFERGAIRLGAEIDPKHLHRMDWFEENAPQNSMVLAASYGDMVGRAEFSHHHITALPPLEARDRNRLILPSVRRLAAEKLREDLQSIRGRYGCRSELGWLEIGRHVSYTRRHLCNTLCIINQSRKIEQAFVSPEVFGYMWQFAPECRNDEVYAHLLRQLDPKLLDVAWARTGGRYDSGEGGDELDVDFHRYGYWLRTELADQLGEWLFGDDTIADLEVFDLDQLRWMYDDWRRERPEDNTLLCTQLSWIATLAIFAREFSIGPPNYDRRPDVTPSVVLEDEAMRRAARASQRARRVSRPWRMKLRSVIGR